MQSLNWYAKRLRAMTPSEMLWRARQTVRDTVDRLLLSYRQRQAARQVSAVGNPLAGPGFTVCDIPAGAWSRPTAESARRRWEARLRARADRIASGYLRVFDCDHLPLGDPIDWNRDHKAGKAAPLGFAPWIDYRDTRVTGDCKFVWEPNRHHQFVVLARAYRASGDARYAQAAATQWRQWLAQCPYGRGMNWRSPLELAIRLINWAWTIDLIRPAGVMTQELQQDVLTSVCLHLHEISRKYSRGSSANNHLIGEAAGVYVASSYFTRLPNAARLRADSRRILCEQILEQTFDDGVTREQATGYHVFVSQFFLLAGLVARQTCDELPAEYWDRLYRMFSFLSVLSAGGNALPMIGDADDGYVLDVDRDPRDPRPWLTVAATMFDDVDLYGEAADDTEAVHWLPGLLRDAGDDPPSVPAAPQPLQSCAFPDAGYYALQCGNHESADRISAVFDCGPFGYGPIAAHGHADALSFTLRAFGVDILVDPGTYDYFTYPRWRDYFRSTQAHNTVAVDDTEQSEMLGSFLWGHKARARCVEWSPTADGGRVCGEHDGYTRLADPVLHRRSLSLDGAQRELVVADEFTTQGRHAYCFCLHFAEHCQVTRCDGGRFQIRVDGGRLTLELDPLLEVEMLRGSESPPGGWVSRGYHQRVPGTTLFGRCAHTGPLRLQTRIEIGRPEQHTPAAAGTDRRPLVAGGAPARYASRGG
jgi:hypothetical protein